VSVTVQTDINALLKTAYRDLFVDSIFQDVTLFDLIPKYSGNVRGSSINHAVELTRSHGGGARDAGEFLPVDYPESFQQSTVTLKRWYWTVSLDGFVVDMFKKGDGAFADYLDLRMRNAQRDASSQLNRICHMDGTGVLAITGAATTAGTVITLKHVWPNGFNGGTPSGGTNYGFGANQFMEEGDSIRIIDPANTTSWVTSTIASIQWDAQTITLNDSVTVSANWVVAHGDQFGTTYGGSGANAKEPFGLRHLIANSGTVQNIATTNRRWKSIIIDKSASPVAYDWTHVTRIVSSAMYKGSSSPQNLVILCHPAMLEEHQRLVDPDLRYEPTDFQLNKGLTAPVFQVLGNKVAVRVTPNMGYQEIVCINTSELERLELSPMDWDDQDGSVIKSLQGKDAIYSYLKYYWAIAARSLNHFARFDGIQVDTDYIKSIHETM
jgi:hypothetical protein